MAKRTVPAPFLTKTYQLVEDPSTNDVVSWNESGSTFVVWNIDEFARTLLPNYFKHNNFSSFVRQLNTYGFRKIVPDKWEFANQYFKREQKELLSEIRRRKVVTSSPTQIPSVGKSLAVVPSPSNSGDDLGSTSTSSPDYKNPRSVETIPISQFADISGENEKLKKDNEILSSEISQAKKQCEELIAFLTENVKVGPDLISLIMRQGTCGSTRDGLVMDGADHVNDDDENCVHDEEEESLKLFGVWLKKKRVREEKMGFCGPNAKEMKKTVEFQASLMMMKSSKVCN